MKRIHGIVGKGHIYIKTIYEKGWPFSLKRWAMVWIRAFLHNMAIYYQTFYMCKLDSVVIQFLSPNNNLFTENR